MSTELRCSDSDQSKRDIPSFIEPRPPLILNPFMRPRPEKGVNLMDLYEDDSVSEDSDWLKVYLRLKPCERPNNLYDVRSDRHLVSSVDTATAGHGRRTLHNVSKMYTFSRIFGPGANQKEIFDQTVKENLKKLPEGHNFTLLTYGASGSGKTYTLMGTVSSPGLVPRSLEYVFKVVDAAQLPLYKPGDNGAEKLGYQQQQYEMQTVKRMCTMSTSFREKYRRASTQLLNDLTSSTFDLSNRTRYYVWVSFVEIYNEKIFDLLTNIDRNKSSSNLHIREDYSGNVYVKGATQAFVRSGEEAYEVMVSGKYNLQVAATGIHAQSSRSHCIFTITMLTETDSGVRASCVRLCDLAGCERLRRTRNTGARMAESRAINSSLHVLERCLRMLQHKQRRPRDAPPLVPYRESKLTRLLGGGLSGARNEAVSMVVALNPSAQYAQENRHVLQLAAVAGDIQVNATVAESIFESSAAQDTTDDSRYELMKLQEENERLHFEIAQAQSVISELQAAMDAKQKESADTMYEVLEAAKDMTRQYYESQLQSLRSEMEEMREDYENQLNAVSLNTSVLRRPSDVGTPSRAQQQNVVRLETELAVKEEELSVARLARIRLEEEVQRLLHCINERDEKDTNALAEDGIECIESDSEEEHNESQVQLTVKKKDINWSRVINQSVFRESPNRSRQNATQESSILHNITECKVDESDEEQLEVKHIEHDLIEHEDSFDNSEKSEDEDKVKEEINEQNDNVFDTTDNLKGNTRTDDVETNKHLSNNNDTVADMDEEKTQKCNENTVHGNTSNVRGTYFVRISADSKNETDDDLSMEDQSNQSSTKDNLDVSKSEKDILRISADYKNETDDDHSSEDQSNKSSAKSNFDVSKSEKEILRIQADFKNKTDNVHSVEDQSNQTSRKGTLDVSKSDKEILRIAADFKNKTDNYHSLEDQSNQSSTKGIFDVSKSEKDIKNKTDNVHSVEDQSNQTSRKGNLDVSKSDKEILRIAADFKNKTENCLSVEDQSNLSSTKGNLEIAESEKEILQVIPNKPRTYLFNDSPTENINKHITNTSLLDHIHKKINKSDKETLKNKNLTKTENSIDESDISLAQFEQFERYAIDETEAEKNENEKVIKPVKENLKDKILRKTVKSIDQSDISLAQFEQLERDARDETEPEKHKMFADIKMVKEKHNLFEEYKQKTKVENSKVASLKFNLFNHDRSPSIVREDVSENFEPNKIIKTLGESFLRTDKLTSNLTNNTVPPKKQASVDMFEGYDSPCPAYKLQEKISIQTTVQEISLPVQKDNIPFAIPKDIGQKMPITSLSEGPLRLFETSKIINKCQLILETKPSENSDSRAQLNHQDNHTTVDKIRQSVDKLAIDETNEEKLLPPVHNKELNRSEAQLNSTKTDNTIEEFDKLFQNVTGSNATAFDLLIPDDYNNQYVKETPMDHKPSEKVKYNLRHKTTENFDKKEKSKEELILESEQKREIKPPKRNLRLRRRKKEDDEINDEVKETTKLKDIANLQKEYSDVTMDVPAAKNDIADIATPEKCNELENVPPADEIQSCQSKSVARSRRKLFTPREVPEDGDCDGDDSGGRLRVPRPSYHRGRARRKL